jgi:hypothetical protein
MSERLLSRQQFQSLASGFMVLTPDENILKFCEQCGLRAQLVERPRSDSIARLGWKKILAGQTTSAAALDANYIRRSDAEIFPPQKR